MTVSTRIIITIVMIIILNLNLKVLTKLIKKYKAAILIFLLLISSALSHRLWVDALLPLIIMIIMVFIRKFRNLQKLIIFLILPLSVIAFFTGFEIFILKSSDFISIFLLI